MQIYKSLLESQTNLSERLPTIEELNTRLANTKSSSTNIPILIFDVKGELLEDTEIESLSKQNAYNEIHFFGAISYLNKSYKKSVNFELKSDNYLSGFNNKESDIFIDFADGRGIQKYSSSQGIITVNYTDLGEKLIKVYREAILNDVSMKIGSSFIINIKANNTEDSTIVSKSDLSSKSSEITINNNGGSAHINLGDDNILDKPIIIIQGFDPIGSITVDEQKDKYSDFEEGLRNNNYDIVYLMLNNTNLPLEDNAAVVKDLIKQINSQKQKNFESIVIGESMGGLLSRMALKQLENENYDHKVGLYVSFDAPHQGANIPPGIQYLFKDVLESRLVSGISSILGIIDITAINLTNLIISPFTGEGIPPLRDVLQINMAYTALDALNSPAVKSMLVRHINPDGYFNNTQNNLKNLGYPSNSRNIALINGSNQSGDLQRKIDGSTFTPGERLIRIPLWRTDCNEFSLNAWSSPVNTNARVSQIKWKIGIYIPDVRIRWENKCIVRVFGTCVLRTKIPVKITVGLKCATTIIDKERHYNFNGASYDDAPGSTLPGLSSLPLDIAASTAFVPTASAIDLSSNAYNSSTDPNGLRAVTNNTILDNFITNNQTPFDEVYSKTWNSNHVFFNIGDFINFNTIITDEFMFEDLDIQNKVITNNRDFEANNNINIGNNINTTSRKIFDSGNVIINNSAIVNFTANNQITLSPGTHFENGTSVNLKINKIAVASKKNVSKPIYSDFKIKIIGAKEYASDKSPSFKVLSSDLNSEYDYSWKLTENNKITSSNNEFIIDEFLYPGIYSMKVEVTSKKSFKTKTLTKVFKINSDLKTYDQSDNLALVLISNDIKMYPNPVVNDVTVIAQKEISKIVIYDLLSKTSLKAEGTNKTWQSFDLTSLSAGTYVLDIHFADNSPSVQKKLIKQ